MIGIQAQDDPYAPIEGDGAYETREEIRRAAASFLLGGLDYDAQLMAIHRVISILRRDKQDVHTEIEKLDAIARAAKGFANELAVMNWVDRLHYSVYEDAARSMTAVGMLAPFTESLFCQAFRGLEYRIEKHKLPGPDSARLRLKGKRVWDCHQVLQDGRWRNGLLAGIQQLSEASGLKRYLPVELSSCLDGLFSYRHLMFHSGFEWPVEARREFQERLNSGGLRKEWFSKAEHGKEPWVFYMTNEFIDHCLELLDQVIQGLGAYCVEVLYPEIRERGVFI